MKVPADLVPALTAPVSRAVGVRVSLPRLELVVSHYGRICFKGRKINLSHVFAEQKVGVKQVEDRIWLVSFMHYDLGYFDDETCRLEPIENPFGATVLPLSSE